MRIAPVLRTIDLLMIALLVGVVFWTFKVKNDSQAALERVAELEKQIEAKKTEIDLLKSDWSLLTNPVRLENLVRRYGSELQLEPIDPSQMTNQHALPPMKPAFEPNQTDEGFAGTDPDIVTGGIPSGNGEEAND